MRVLRRWRMFGLGLVALPAVLAGLAVVGTSTASAGFDSYCNRTISGYGTCTGPLHSLTANSVSDRYGGRKCAGAFREDGTFYGSYYCATTVNPCHTYSGDRLLYPAAHNGVDVSNYIQGLSSWGSDRLSGCPAGV